MAWWGRGGGGTINLPLPCECMDVHFCMSTLYIYTQIYTKIPFQLSPILGKDFKEGPTQSVPIDDHETVQEWTVQKVGRCFGKRELIC